MTATLTGGIFQILSLSELLPVYLVDRLQLTIAVSGNRYCIFGQVQWAIEN